MVHCECDRSRWKCSLCKCSLIGFTAFCACESISCLNPLLKKPTCIDAEWDDDDDHGDET